MMVGILTNCSIRHAFNRTDRKKCQDALNCIKRGKSIKSIDRNHWQAYQGECQSNPRPQSVLDYWRNTVGLETACNNHNMLCDEYFETGAAPSYENDSGQSPTNPPLNQNTQSTTPQTNGSQYHSIPRPNPYIVASSTQSDNKTLSFELKVALGVVGLAIIGFVLSKIIK